MHAQAAQAVQASEQAKAIPIAAELGTIFATIRETSSASRARLHSIVDTLAQTILTPTQHAVLQKTFAERDAGAMPAPEVSPMQAAAFMAQTNSADILDRLNLLLEVLNQNPTPPVPAPCARGR